MVTTCRLEKEPRQKRKNIFFNIMKSTLQNFDTSYHRNFLPRTLVKHFYQQLFDTCSICWCVGVRKIIINKEWKINNIPEIFFSQGIPSGFDSVLSHLRLGQNRPPPTILSIVRLIGTKVLQILLFFVV